MRKKSGWTLVNIGLFVLSFLVVLTVDMFVQISSGDDLFHLKLAQSSSLFEFIRRCGTARISKKISLYFVMRSDILVWRVMNAIVFTLFYFGLCKIIQILSRNRVNDKDNLFIRFIVLISLCLAHISIFGFSIFWVTGSQDYLWPLTFGVLSIILEIQSYEWSKVNSIKLIAMLVFAMWGGLGQEQISLLLLCVSGLLCIVNLYRNKSVLHGKYAMEVLLIRLVCFIILLVGSNERIVQSHYYADFWKMSLIKHLFLTVQWELSALANEMKMLLIVIWLVLAFLLYNHSNKKASMFMIVFIVVAISGHFNDLGINTITDMGIRVEDIVKATDNTVSFGTLTEKNWINLLCWLGISFVVTPYFLKDRRIVLILYMLGLMLPLMQVVSSGMYVSGGRTFFVTSVLFSISIGLLFSDSKIRRYLPVIAGVVVSLGIYQLGLDMSYYLKNVL